MRNAQWFVADYLPRWLTRAMINQKFVIEALNIDGQPDALAPTTLTQARVVFALAHLHLVTRDQRFLDVARDIHAFMDGALRDPDGGYWQSTECFEKRSYDQSFALMALVTLRRADRSAVPAARISNLWHFIVESLTESATGALWENMEMARHGAANGDLRAQNPHMHMFEAALQAFEMTGEVIWMDRAQHLFTLLQRYFVDPDTGAICEFVAADLTRLTTQDGSRREPGHQYEWAWLLHRFADLGGDATARTVADRMISFVEAHGLRGDGPLRDAPFDALDRAGDVTEATHLLWPLTEAGKYYAATGALARAHAIENLIFKRYFTGGPNFAWSNQLDGNGRVLWPTALSRLIYHVALFVTEGARAGLWPLNDIDQTQTFSKEITI